MSVQELEARVRELPPEELRRFAEWFDEYWINQMDAVNLDVSEAQKEELLRRKAEYLADPSSATAWDEAAFDRFIQTLADARTQRASSGKG